MQIASVPILLLSVQIPTELVLAVALVAANDFFSEMLEKLLSAFLGDHCDG